MPPDNQRSRLRALERSFEALGCGISSVVRAKGDLKRTAHLDNDHRVAEIATMVIEATEKLAVAQSKLTYVIQDEVDGMYTGWCNHRAKIGTSLSCKCGPAPF